MNFVSFVDFYEPEKKAIFQAGTLYLDSRACGLCVPVGDLETHVRLAAQSHLCLIYCQCQRTEKDGSTATGTIAAALTAGDLVSLIDGATRTFVDNDGKEWDTKINQGCPQSNQPAGSGLGALYPHFQPDKRTGTKNSWPRKRKRSARPLATPSPR